MSGQALPKNRQQTDQGDQRAGMEHLESSRVCETFRINIVSEVNVLNKILIYLLTMET